MRRANERLLNRDTRARIVERLGGWNCVGYSPREAALIELAARRLVPWNHARLVRKSAEQSKKISFNCDASKIFFFRNYLLINLPILIRNRKEEIDNSVQRLFIESSKSSTNSWGFFLN